MRRWITAVVGLLAIGFAGAGSAAVVVTGDSFSTYCGGHAPACFVAYVGCADADINHWAGEHASETVCGHVSMSAEDIAMGEFWGSASPSCAYGDNFTTSLRSYVSGSPCSMSTGIRLAQVIPETEFTVINGFPDTVAGDLNVGLNCVASPKYKAVYDTDMVVGGPYYSEEPF